MSLTLYELAGQYAMLANLDDADFETALGQLQDEISTKAGNIAGLVRSLEAEAQAFSAEMQRLKGHADAHKRKADRLKAYLLENLTAAGLSSVKTALFNVRVQNSPPACKVDDAAAVPELFQRVIPAQIVPDVRSIIEAWKQTGEQVPGATVTVGQHIRIS